MLSREANQIYWTGRYLERAENLCRFIYVNLHYMLDMDAGDEESWMALVKATGDQKQFSKQHTKANEDNVMKFLTFDQDNPNSMISCVKLARQNAKSLRSTLSAVMWEDINVLYWHTINHSKKKSLRANREKFYSEFQRLYLRFLGSYHATMTRDEAWHFLNSGIMMERADKTARILDVKYFASMSHKAKRGNIFDSVLWRALLKSVTALHMYRKSYADINASQVCEFLVRHPRFPRSILFCVTELQRSFNVIISEVNPDSGMELAGILEKLENMIKSHPLTSDSETSLHDFIDQFQTELNQVDSHIFNQFFEVKAVGEDLPIMSQSQG